MAIFYCNWHNEEETILTTKLKKQSRKQNINQDQTLSNESFQDDPSKNNDSSEREDFIEFGYQGSDEFLTAPNPKKLEPLKYFGYDFFKKTTSCTH